MTAAGVLWLPLGELLVERGLLSTGQLELALAEQRRTGLRLGEVLVSVGYVSETVLARMLLEQVGLTAAPGPEAHVKEPEPEPEPKPAVEPIVVRLEDAPRDRGRWWSRTGNKARVKQLEKVLSDFEQRSRAIEADIARVRTTLRSLRDAGA